MALRSRFSGGKGGVAAQGSVIGLLLFWPLFGLGFSFLERVIPEASCTVVGIPLDDQIPLCPAFAVPYLFWFLYLGGSVVYSFFFAPAVFRRLMRFVISTYSITLLIYLLFPSCQRLRPTELPDGGVCTDLIRLIYASDTNTNVCPSLHVIGSVAACLALWQLPRAHRGCFRVCTCSIAVLICISTLFCRQHSVLDILAALPVCLFGCLFFFLKKSCCGA